VRSSRAVNPNQPSRFSYRDLNAAIRKTLAFGPAYFETVRDCVPDTTAVRNKGDTGVDDWKWHDLDEEAKRRCIEEAMAEPDAGFMWADETQTTIKLKK
jgi:hypothetical protein